MTELTATQQKVFSHVRERLTAGESAPTLRELADAFGWRSKRSAECHIEAIVRKGWLLREPGKRRALRLPLTLGRQRVAEIPLFGSIPAGFAQDRKQEPNGCISIDIGTLSFKPTARTFALEVRGDSMIGKHIVDGDMVVLEHGATPKPGDVVAALVDGESTLKTFLSRNGKPYLKAENPKYPDLLPAQELVIQGVLKLVIRRAR